MRACSVTSALASTPVPGPRARRAPRVRSPPRTPCPPRRGPGSAGDPLVDGEVAAVPVVLRRHVGQRALAGEGAARRRPVGRLDVLGAGGHRRATVDHRFGHRRTISLRIEGKGDARDGPSARSVTSPYSPAPPWRAPRRSAPRTSPTTTPRQRATTPSGRSSSTPAAAADAGEAREGARRPLAPALPSRPRGRRGHRLLLAQPPGRGTGPGRGVATDISPGMLAALRASAAARASPSRPPRARPPRSLPRRRVRPRPRPRRAAPPAGPRRRLRRVPPTARPRRTLVFCGEPSRHGHRLAAVPKRLGRIAAPAWRRRADAPTGARPRPGGARLARARWWTSTAFTPAELRTSPRRGLRGRSG